MKKALVSFMMIAAILVLASYAMQPRKAESDLGTASAELSPEGASPTKLSARESKPDPEMKSGGLSPENTFPTSLHAQGPSNGRETVYETGPVDLNGPCPETGEPPASVSRKTSVSEKTVRRARRSNHVLLRDGQHFIPKTWVTLSLFGGEEHA